jgi:hypothetical protein
MGQTILGQLSPQKAAARLRTESAPYSALSRRPVVGAFDLVGVFATAAEGADGMYRLRQDDDVIQIYLNQARAAGARLMLDIQPGRARIIDEVTELGEWLAQPDVDLAIDPEWNVGPSGIPNVTEGKVTAREINEVTKRLSQIVRDNRLPPKILTVHQFKRTHIRQRKRIKRRRGVQVVLNFDGQGARAPKEAGYEALASPKLFDGFSLFYTRDTPLMKPRSVLKLQPEPDFLLYQ